MDNKERVWPPVRRPRKRGVNLRFVAVALALVLLIGSAVGGTLAWLTDTTNEVKNVFTPSDINVTLEESETDFKMVPGCDIAKDPEVTVLAGSEACWLFVKVEKSENYDQYLNEYQIADGWTPLAGNDGVFYREVGDLTAETAVAQAFSVLKNDKVTVLNTVTKTQMDAIDGVVAEDAEEGASEAEIALRPTLTFTAYAIQKAQIDTAAKAWEILNS